MNFIPLQSSDRLCPVSDRVYDSIIALKTDWYIRFENGRPSAIVSTKDFNGKQIRLNRFILGCVEDNGLDADHRDRNICNNLDSNLRWATLSQSAINKRKQVGNYTSKYKGVSWCKVTEKWRTRITFKGKRINLGFFDSEIEAALAYNKKAKELFGEFAFLNVI